MKRFAWLLPLLALLFATACHNGGSSQNTTNVRLLNAVVDAEPLDMLIDTSVKLSAVSLGTTSAQTSFDSGTHEVQLRSSTNSAILYDKSLAFNSGTNYSLIAYGQRAAMNTVLVIDDTTATSTSGRFKIRAVGVAPNGGTVDVYVANGSIASIPATIANLAYASSSDFIEIPIGSYQITFTTAGTKDILFQSNAIAFADGQFFTVLVFPTTGGKLVSAALLQTGGAGTLLSNPVGRVKATNAIPDSTANVNFKVDGTIILSAVPFTGASTYVNVNTGARQFQLEASNVPGTNIATLSQTIASANDYSLVSIGNLASPRLAAFQDDNTPPAAGQAKVRFANALPTAGNVDVLVNFAGQAAGIAQGTASSYFTLPPRTDYVISFTTPGGINAIATLSAVTIEAGAIYTAYVFGPTANAQAKLVRDK